MTYLEDRITYNPQILQGKAIIKGTRISVEFILDLLAKEWTYDQILRNYPNIKMEDIIACLEYAHAAITDEVVHPLGI